jgi:hypothetical protein
MTQNEGTLYAKITRQINITLTYTFNASVQFENATTNYSLTETLKTQAWQHQTTKTPPASTNQTEINVTIPPIYSAQLELVKKRIESETGASSSTYTLEIEPTFSTEAFTTAGMIYETFTPTLTVAFKRTEQGDIIAIEDLNQTEEGALTESQTATRPDVLNQRYASYFLLTTSVMGIFVSTHFHRKVKAETYKTSVEKVKATYKDLIIEAKEPPKIPPDAAVINLNNMDELVKTAEILAKPIILVRQPSPVFIVMDQNSIYKHNP